MCNITNKNVISFFIEITKNEKPNVLISHKKVRRLFQAPDNVGDTVSVNVTTDMINAHPPSRVSQCLTLFVQDGALSRALRFQRPVTGG